MGDPAKTLPDLPSTPTSLENFKRTREALGVGAYTSHAGLPRFVTAASKKIRSMNLRNNDDELTPAKKRERVLVISALILGLLYAYNEYGSKSFNAMSGGDVPSMDILLQDPVFGSLVEQVKTEKNLTDVGPEVYREAIERYRQRR